ncbi:hypothetical protein Tco_1048453 [Tanacetum coccineum]
MHNNIMAAGSKDRPPMLATRRYAQWRSQGPYKPTTVVVPAAAATDDSLEVPQHTTVETILNMSPDNKAHFQAEKEAIFFLLTGIGDEIYSTVDACQTANEMWIAIERLQQARMQYQKEVNEICAEIIAKSANPLALVAAAQPYPDNYYHAPKPQRAYAPAPKQSFSTRSNASTRHKGKEIAKPVTPPSESGSDEDSDPEQAQKDKEMQKNLALIAKYFKKLYKPTNNNLRTSSNSRNKTVDTSTRYNNDNQSGLFGNQRTMAVAGARETVGCQKGVPLQAEQVGWLEDTNEEIDEQELEAHYTFMAKIQEVLLAESDITAEPLEEVQYHDEYNVFANETQHFGQPESINDTHVLEKDNSNVTPDSSNMCNNDNQILKQLKKANASLTQELKEYKSNLEESNATRDSCLIALQTKQTELEKCIAFNDRTIDYNKLQSKLNETLGLLAQKDIDIKEGLKLKAYEISAVKQKHDELVKQSLLTKSSFGGLLKEKSKISYDTSDLANRFAPDWEETITLEKESRSKLD